jgi:hypothetical protein
LILVERSLLGVLERVVEGGLRPKNLKPLEEERWNI